MAPARHPPRPVPELDATHVAPEPASGPFPSPTPTGSTSCSSRACPDRRGGYPAVPVPLGVDAGRRRPGGGHAGLRVGVLVGHRLDRRRPGPHPGPQQDAPLDTRSGTGRGRLHRPHRHGGARYLAPPPVAGPLPPSVTRHHPVGPRRPGRLHRRPGGRSPDVTRPRPVRRGRLDRRLRALGVPLQVDRGGPRARSPSTAWSWSSAPPHWPAPSAGRSGSRSTPSRCWCSVRPWPTASCPGATAQRSAGSTSSPDCSSSCSSSPVGSTARLARGPELLVE